MNIYRFGIILSTFLYFSCAASKKINVEEKYPLSYTVNTLKPSSHYVQVELDLDLTEYSFAKDYVDLKMPVWTPGSYLVREFSKNVEGFKAEDSQSNSLKFNKIAKNTWRIKTQNNSKIKIKYEVYANELSVRTSHVDASHAYLNGGSIFMFVPQLKHEPIAVDIQKHASFKKVSTALPEKKGRFIASDYDLLVDSFFEIGNQEEFSFDYQGVKHTIANYSLVPLNMDIEKVKKAYLDVVSSAHKVMGSGKHPCTNYLFLVHHLPGIGGGLEHLNGTTCQTSPEIYNNSIRFKGFMGLIAHEYFHLWNVKRLRPEALGPFDYENENYTHMLWVSEGFTAYYQEDILKKAGFYTDEEYLNTLASDINLTENQKGNRVQSAAESSFDAWIKYYRPNENSDNSSVSYYNKGSVLGGILNALIIDGSGAKYSLDNVMTYLYAEYYEKLNRGFTDREFQLACEKFAEMSLEDIFEKHIYGTEAIPFSDIYAKIGLNVSIDEASKLKPSIGATLRGNVVLKVVRDGAFENAGINAGDQLISVNGAGIANFLEGKKVGEVIEIEYKRYDQTFKTNVTIQASNYQNHSLRLNPNATDQDKKEARKFLN
jgi:predicted metalloprotease with PDZ domain